MTLLLLLYIEDKVHGTVPRVVRIVLVSPKLNQFLDRSRLPSLGCEVQWRVAVLVSHLHTKAESCHVVHHHLNVFLFDRLEESFYQLIIEVLSHVLLVHLLHGFSYVELFLV